MMKLKTSSLLLNWVCALMAEIWSPEQVVGRMRRTNPDNPTLHVTHETIYCAFYALQLGELIAQLRFAHKARMPRTWGHYRRGTLSNMPIEVAARLIPGYWEGDHIKGPGNQGSVGTLLV